MGILGFIEELDRSHIIGWAMDSELPEEAVSITVMLHGNPILELTAAIPRIDLSENHVGTGCYGFAARFAAPLAPEDVDHLEVLAVRANGSRRRINRFVPDSSATHLSPKLAFHALVADPDRPGFVPQKEQRPVFVLGVRRSGTSAVAHAIFLRTRYKGRHEGHFFDLLTPLARTINEFYAAKSFDINQPSGLALISDVPRARLANAMLQVFRDMASEVLTHPFWVDKTPTPDMISAVPSLLAIWPDARFIFVRRRAFENLASQARKFPEESFRKHCEFWAACMSNWLRVREGLCGKAIELDQVLLATDPSHAANLIGNLLDLDTIERRDVAWFLTHKRPEQTQLFSQNPKIYPPATWDDLQIKTFDLVCRPLFSEFGYGEEARYFISDDPIFAGRPI